MSPDTSADDAPIVSPDRLRAVVQAMLRGAQAAGWTDDALAAATGLKAKRIKSYRVENKEPAASALLSLMLGQRAVTPVMATIGYAAEPIDESCPRCAGEVVAECAKEFAVIAGAAAKGRFDHTTEPAVMLAADQMIEVLVPLSSVGRAA